MQLHNECTSKRNYRVLFKAELRVSHSDYQSKLLIGDSIDLSTGGVFLIVTCPFNVDDIVKLKLYVLGEREKAISCDSRVAWINRVDKELKPEYPTGVGLQFLDLSPEDLCSIVGFLEGKSV